MSPSRLRPSRCLCSSRIGIPWAAGSISTIRGFSSIPTSLSSGFGWEILRLAQTRPLTFLTFHWNYLVGGAAPFGFHLVNVSLHAANALLVMFVARRSFSGPVALLAGALFAIHPLQSQAVNYVFERATLLAALFALLSLLLYLQERYWWAVADSGRRRKGFRGEREKHSGVKTNGIPG